MDIKVVTLDGQGIAFCVDSYTNISGNALRFSPWAPKVSLNLEVIIDDLFNRLFLLFLQIFFITCNHLLPDVSDSFCLQAKQEN
jgi:hypothetical protein